MNLTDPIIKAAKPRVKRYSLTDGKGLSLYVQPSGAKWWRYRYYYQGKEKMLSMGIYPDVTLKQARAEHTRLRDILAQGTDPHHSIVKSRNNEKRWHTKTVLNQ